MKVLQLKKYDESYVAIKKAVEHDKSNVEYDKN